MSLAQCKLEKQDTVIGLDMSEADIHITRGTRGSTVPFKTLLREIHGSACSPLPNPSSQGETQSKGVDINAGQSMATVRPIKAAQLLQWGEQVVMLCLSAVVPPTLNPPTTPPVCAIIMCYCPLLRSNGCAPPRSVARKGKKAHRGALYSTLLERSMGASAAGSCSSTPKTNIRSPSSPSLLFMQAQLGS